MRRMAIVSWEAPRRGLGRVCQLLRRAGSKSPQEIKDRLALALFDPPTDLVLDVSTRCNLHCVMCSLAAYGPGCDMDLDIVKALGPALAGLRHISLTCSGEPLLNPQILDMIAYIKSNSQATVGLFTNGTLLTPELAHELVRLGLDWLVVSLDAATREAYAAIRGDHFATVLENVRGLRRARQALGSLSPALSLGFVAMRRNAAELPGVVSLAAELGAGEVRVHGLEPYSEEMAGQILYGPAAADYQKYVAVAIREARRLGVGMRLPASRIGPQRYCRPFAHIAWDGTLRPCGELVYARPFYFLGARKQHAELAFGNVREDNFCSLWHSAAYKRFRRSLRRGDFLPICDGCLLSYSISP